METEMTILVSESLGFVLRMCICSVQFTLVICVVVLYYIAQALESMVFGWLMVTRTTDPRLIVCQVKHASG